MDYSIYVSTKLHKDLHTVGLTLVSNFKVVVVKLHIYRKKSADDPDLRYFFFTLYGQIGPALVSLSLSISLPCT